MAERPIIMSGDSVRAILAGRKTVTRRVLKPQIEKTWVECMGWCLTVQKRRGTDRWLLPNAYRQFVAECPHGHPGDLLWVRETWCPVDDTEYGGHEWTDYKATPRYGEDEPAGWPPEDRGDPDAGRWRSPRYMPKSRARLWLRVLDVRPERLQVITDEDARAEGCALELVDGRTVADLPGADLWDYRLAFEESWNFLNARRGHPWESNPWVWRIEFERDGGAP